MITEIRDLFGDIIIDDVLFQVSINMAIEKIVDTIQNKFDIQIDKEELLKI